MIYLGIGSNLNGLKKETPLQNCKKALNAIKKEVKVKKISSWYTSMPIPRSNQPWYVNGVIEISTEKKSIELLNFLIDLEKKFGRRRKKRNEARIIDLDILDYKGKILFLKNKLITPHPRMHQRAFVLLPLEEINSEWKHPVNKKKISNLIKRLDKNQQIRKIKDNN